MESSCEQNLPDDLPQAHDDDDTSAVAAILCAEDERQVLGAPRDASIDSLRCRFVATATSVHPGANHSDGAELAFKRVAIAWQKLNTELLAPTFANPLMERESDVLQDVSLAGAAGLPLDKALDAFAVAVSECAAGSVDEDIVTFAGILGHAQRLVEEQEQYHSGTTKQLKAVAAGLAFSAGCWAAGAVAVANGCAGVGLIAQRAAVMQGVGQVAAGVATACRHPATVKAARAAGKRCQGPACPSQASAVSLLSALPSCIPQPSRSRENSFLGGSGSSSSAQQGNDVLPVGTEVTVVGLRVKQELNGRHGVVVGAGEQEERYQVRIFPERVCNGNAHLKLIKRENLERRMNQPHQCPGTIQQFF